MNHLLDNQLLSADEVLLEPQLGQLRSRSDAELMPFIYSAPMDTVTGYALAKEMIAQDEIPVICREISDKEYCACISSFHDTATFFAVGATEVELNRFISRIKQTENLPDDLKLNVAIDIAHGDSIVAYNAIAFLRSLSFIGDIMSGSICTPAAAIRSVTAGCTHLRIGVGPGSVCTTRMMTGVGVPQLSAVYLIHRELTKVQKRSHAILIADGGIKYPGDAVKYLSAGADGIMMGSVLNKTRESLGWETRWPEQEPTKVISFPRPDPEPIFVKRFRGHASADFQRDHRGEANRCPEGTSTKEFLWDGTTVKSVCEKFRGGVASAISYLGLTSIAELCPENVKFMRITTSTFMESMPHNREVDDVKSI